MYYYAGFNNSKIINDDEDDENNSVPIIDKFTLIPSDYPIDDIDIGWNYSILWQNDIPHICGNIDRNIDHNSSKDLKIFSNLKLELPQNVNEGFTQTIAGKNCITALSNNNEIWQYNIINNKWKKIQNFIYNDDDDDDDDDNNKEYIVKLFQGGCTVALTNLGRVYNIPTLVEMPKRVKFINVACGFDHTIMLAENGDVYSMGMGTRGQLGHGDLEDCDNPKIIEALAGIKVLHISAAGWHNAVVTDQGDLYTWGWNTNGELGIIDDDTKVFATPKPVYFNDDEGKNFEAMVKKVECGNVFTICMLDDHSLWGSGSNKYGQLGMPTNVIKNSKKFIKLSFNNDNPIDNLGNEKILKDFKCREWSTLLITDKK